MGVFNRMRPTVSFFWFRRDLRLDDNAALYHALKGADAVIPLFIFDTTILDYLDDKEDKRVQFIHQELHRLNNELRQYGSSLLVRVGKPVEVWKQLLEEYTIKAVYTNRDYEPTAIARDEAVQDVLKQHGAKFFTYKDQVIFERYEVLKDDGKPYTVFTPYSKKWKAKLVPFYYKPYPTLSYAGNFYKTGSAGIIPPLESFGFKSTPFIYPERALRNEIVSHYTENRDYPAVNGTSKLGIHLRFGTLSIRKLLSYALERNQTYVNELIWREFYQQILFHFPQVVTRAFKTEYDAIQWENEEAKFAAWCEGKTGFPLVDAGMRELNATGYMHNRVRMVTASFLTKNLLVDWRWGEAYFAAKLLDFDLASNNGGWQWASGSGTDAAPYFRVFNPQLQLEKFDPQLKYVKQWVPEYDTADYVAPIISIADSRDRMLKAYKIALEAGFGRLSNR
ncbi:MAG TPA: deoxyribodipyrimidine photo-lyase [Chitinophagales bacterium]|nr:deoxyribodipyrimidine photo-lyase [Chitinophagales bacterium]